MSFELQFFKPNHLQKQVDRFWEQWNRGLPQLATTEFIPACDMEETDSEYLLTLDVPGMKKEQIQVTISDNVLTIAGEHKEEKKEKTKGRKITERYEGSFTRSFYLPEMGNWEKITAEQKDGVLKIAVPKAAAKARQIPVREPSKPEAKAVKVA